MADDTTSDGAHATSGLEATDEHSLPAIEPPEYEEHPPSTPPQLASVLPPPYSNGTVAYVPEETANQINLALEQTAAPPIGGVPFRPTTRKQARIVMALLIALVLVVLAVVVGVLIVYMKGNRSSAIVTSTILVKSEEQPTTTSVMCTGYPSWQSSPGTEGAEVICQPHDEGGLRVCSSSVSQPVEVHVLALHQPLGSPARNPRQPPSDVRDVKVVLSLQTGWFPPSSVKLMLASHEAAHWKIQAPPGVTISEIVVSSYYIHYSSVSVVNATISSEVLVKLPDKTYYGFGVVEDQEPSYGYTPNKDLWQKLESFLLEHFGYLSSFIGTFETGEFHLVIGHCI